MHPLPPVSIMCLTYGRTHVLEEALHSFLIQDYAGPKEMIILNDLDCQTLHFDHPDVKIINVPKRFYSVGEKRNACAALASHDILFVWDDDDIYLPHRISFSLRHIDENTGYFKPNQSFMLNKNIISGPIVNLFHSSSCFTRELFNRMHGYPHIGSGQDAGLEHAIGKTIRNKNYTIIDLSEIFYLYRWNGTGSYHLSNFGTDAPGKESGNAKVVAFVQNKIQKAAIQTGDILLKPHWLEDYSARIRSYITTLTSPPTLDGE